MKKIVKFSSGLITGIATAFVLATGRAMAMSVQEGAEAAKADIMPSELVGPDGVFTKISNTLLLVIGVISVTMLIYGGFRYVISGGDNKKVTDAKNTILYAIIGLIISLLAYAIVNFVIAAITGQTMTINS